MLRAYVILYVLAVALASMGALALAGLLGVLASSLAYRIELSRAAQTAVVQTTLIQSGARG